MKCFFTLFLLDLSRSFSWFDFFCLFPPQVTRQVAQCKCAKRFQVEQIGENKYRVSAARASLFFYDFRFI